MFFFTSEWITSIQSCEQQPPCLCTFFTLNKSKWQPSLIQLVCVHHMVSHIGGIAMISSVILSPKRWSNTKFFPMNLLSKPSLTCLAYSMIPPSSW
jgi:hypothetical protein